MDIDKRNNLVKALSGQPEPLLIPVREFFDGNDDMGSIGCNLMQHPGVDAFRSILVGLLDRDDVDAVYADIAELDPGEDSWPFADTILIVGSIAAAELARILEPLEPDELGPAREVPQAIADTYCGPVYAAWWA